MTLEVRDQMFAHAIAALPNEACGMFSVRNGAELIDLFHPMTNSAASETVFALDGKEMLDLETNVEATNRSLVGVMHSHTTTSPYPSPTDVHDAGRYDPSASLRHVIVSLRDAEPVLRCYTIRGDEIIEIPVDITNGDDATQDEGGAVAAVMQLPTLR